MVDQQPQVTWARVRGPEGSTSCPGQIALLSEGTRSQQDVTGDSGPGQKSREVVQMSRGTQAHA